MTDQTARLLVASNALADSVRPGELDATLSAITTTAVTVLPQVDFSSISINHPGGQLETKGATDELICDLDATQHDLHEGPCYYAVTEEAYVVSSNLAADERFPKYGPEAASKGIRSQVGLRLYTGDRAQGALNLYSKNVGAFEDLADLGALFATQAAMAIGYANEVSNLRTALETRTVIGKAVGIVMERYKLPDDRAFAFLTRLSQHRNVKLRTVAEEIVTANDVPA
jgi:GAF domain-containing protein